MAHSRLFSGVPSTTKMAKKTFRRNVRFVPGCDNTTKSIELESRSLTAPIYILNLPNPGIAGQTGCFLGVDQNKTSTTNGTMVIQTGSTGSSNDVFRDGGSVTYQGSSTIAEQVTTNGSPDGNYALGVSFTQKIMQTSTCNRNAQNTIVGATSHVVTNGPLTWRVGDDATPSPFSPWTKPITLSGSLQLSFTGMGFVGGFTFTSSATGISAKSEGTSLVVTHPVNNVLTTTTHANFFNPGWSVTIPYTVIDSNPSAGESISYGSTLMSTMTIGGTPGTTSRADTFNLTFSEKIAAT